MRIATTAGWAITQRGGGMSYTGGYLPTQANTVMLDLSLASGPQGLTAADLRHSPATFGMNEGLAQVRALLKRFGITATVTVPAAEVAAPAAGRQR